MPQFEAARVARAGRARARHARLRRADHAEARSSTSPTSRARDLSSLEVLSYGGAPMPFPVIRRAIERLPKTDRLRERLRPDRDHVDADGARPRRPPARRRPERGRAHAAPPALDRPAAARRRGADRRRRRAARSAASEVGEIQVRTPRVMKGYAGAADVAAHRGRLAADARPRLGRRGRLSLRRRAARTT